jgi:hypothetical protein
MRGNHLPMSDFSSIDDAIGSADPEDRAFERWYGPWQPLPIADAAAELANFDAPWWICGGQAIDAFTGTDRLHDDLDVGFSASDLPLLREALAPTYHLWSAGAGMLRPLNDEYPELHPESSQVWIREHAWAPWRLDLLATPGGDGTWINKRDERQVLRLDEATWTDSSGLRYLAPELVLVMKAHLHRPKDELDLSRTLSKLELEQRTRLDDQLRRQHPGHPWIARLAGD